MANNIANLPATPAPRTFTCGPCKVQYPMGAETKLYVYKKQAWFNHITTKCVKCGTVYTVWYLKMEDIGYMMVHNTKKADDKLVVIHADFCDDPKIIREFCLDNKKPFPPDLFLSPRRIRQIDNQVAFWAYLLEQIEPTPGK